MTDELRATAIHEAGHVVAAFLLGRGITRATIESAGDNLGSVALRPRADSWSDRLLEAGYECSGGGFIDGRLRRQVEVEIMVALAGGVTAAACGEDGEAGCGFAMLPPDVSAALSAEAGRPVDKVLLGGDWACVTSLSEAVTSSEEEAGAYVDWLYQRTVNLTHHPLFMPAVEAVAAALVEHRTLSARRLRKVMAEAQGGVQAAAIAASPIFGKEAAQ